jgi:hypothetical protein
VASPLILVLAMHPAQLRSHFRELSLINYLAECPNCRRIAETTTRPGFLVRFAEDFCASWLSYFDPRFLFTRGDRGGHWELLYPPGYGMLLPEQAFLIACTLIGAIAGKRRREVILLLGWLFLAAIPAAMLVPAGVRAPEGVDQTPTPIAVMNPYHANVPLTPRSLLSHPEARHDVLAIVPWILLSAIGFVTLVEYLPRSKLLQLGVIFSITLGICFHGFGFVRYYFNEYAIMARPYFYWGLDRAIQAALEFRQKDEPILFSSRIHEGYSQVLFATGYSPLQLQKEGLRYPEGDYPLVLHPHANPISAGPYRFEPFEAAFQGFPSALFVVPGMEPALAYLAPQSFGQSVSSSLFRPKVDRLKTIYYPDGAVAYEILRKEGESCSPTTKVVLKAGVDTMICSFKTYAPLNTQAFMNWNAVIENPDRSAKQIECRLLAGNAELRTFQKTVFEDKQQAWYINALLTPDESAHSDGTTWQWRCRASGSVAIDPISSDLHKLSYAGLAFISAAQR